MRLPDVRVGDIISPPDADSFDVADLMVIAPPSQAGADQGKLRLWVMTIGQGGQIDDSRAWPWQLPEEDEVNVVYRARDNRNPAPVRQAGGVQRTEPVYAPLAQPELTSLQLAAETLADGLEGRDPAGGVSDAYDPGRSSSGEEYVTSPDSAGFYVLVAGRPAQVVVRFVTDPDVIDEVLAELDDEHFETDSGTPPEGDPEIAAARLNRRVTPTAEHRRLARSLVADVDADADDIPGSCDISGSGLTDDQLAGLSRREPPLSHWE